MKKIFAISVKLHCKDAKEKEVLIDFKLDNIRYNYFNNKKQLDKLIDGTK